MKRIFLSLLAIMVAASFLAWVPAAHAQGEASLVATVDRKDLSLGETVMLTLTLSTPDGSMPQLQLSSLDEFRVVGSSQSLQTSVVNGDISAVAAYTFELQPVKAGDLIIPSFRLDWNGQLLTTDPISISVSQGNGASNNSAPSAPLPQAPAAQSGVSPNRKGDQDLFIETTTDKQSVYVGEAVKFTLRLYSSLMSFGQPNYESPKFVGFWHPQKPEIQQYYANGSDGTPYNVTELTTWLFPTSPGQATIDPATVTTEGGFFSTGARVQSDPVTIEVKPLPDGAPAGYSGAVGQFEIKATPDRTSTRLGEPVTLKVELTGTGNWGTLGDPQWPDQAEWRVYNQATHSQSDIANGQMTGSRQYELLWTPLAEGKLTIPAIDYTYFDPAAGQYQTISTQAQSIEVAQGDPALAASLPQNTSSGSVPASTSSAAPLQIKSNPAAFTRASKPLTKQTGFLLLFLVPLGLVAGDLSLAYRKHYLETHAGELRRSKAYRRARRQIGKISPRSKNVQVEISRILLTYLEDLIQQPLAGLSHSALAQVLQEYRLRPELVQQVIETLFIGEASEYANQELVSYEQAVDSARMLLDDLEKSRS